MSVDPYNGIFIRLGVSGTGKEIWDRINRYRKIQGWSWRFFIMKCIAEEVYQDDPILSEDIANYLLEDGRKQ